MMYIYKLVYIEIKIKLLNTLKWIINLSMLNKSNAKIMYMQLKMEQFTVFCKW